MDLFKLLTRSTNLSKQTSLKTSSKEPVLPSSGQNPHPQLFGNNDWSEEAIVTKKRKRKYANNIEEDIPSGINFFHPGPNPSNTEAKSSQPRHVVVEQIETVEDDEQL